MKKIRMISLILVFAMLLMAVPAVQAQGNSQQNVLDEIPYTAYDSAIAPFDYSSMEIYTADNAPTEIAGFTGYAMKLTGSGGGVGITLDFSDRHIPLSKILTLNIRVFYPTETNQVRVTANKGSNYALQYNKNSAYAGLQWQELKIAGDKLAYNGYINSSGELGKFCLLVRLLDNNAHSFYIDYVSVTLTDDINDEIPYTPNDLKDLSAYIGNPAEFFTESEAVAAGVPAGYTGYVIKLTNKGQTGIALDYTDQHIAATDIKSLDFRIYYTASEIKSDGIRLRDTSNNWIMYAPAAAGQWQTLHIEDSTTINNLCTNGELGKFALCFRFVDDTNNYTCYVDSVTVTRYSDIKKEIPFTSYDSTIAPFDYSSMEIYTADNAPTEIAGFTGYAMKLTGSGGGIGLTLDFSNQHIPLSKILTLNIRVFYPAETNQVRVTANKGSNYALQYDKNSAYAGTQWQEFKIAGDKLAYNGYINSSGELGKFCLLVRLLDNNAHSFYIDYVSVTLTDDIKDEIPYTPNDIADLSAYIGNPAEFYTESEAAAAGVPAGYSGYVIKVKNKNQTGLALDYTDQHIAASDIKAIDFRIYYTASEIKSDGIRLRDTSNSWIMYAPAAAGQWQTLHIEDSTTINKLCTNGELGKFALCFRFSSDTAAYTCYVDYVRVNIKTTVNYDDVKVEIPYVTNDVPDFLQYVSSPLNDVYTEVNGASAGIPSGYTGYVLKLTGAGYTGFAVDFSDQKIPLSIINAVNIRMYYPDNAVKEHETEGGLRLKYNQTGITWKLYNPEHPGEWTVFSVTDKNVLANLCDENGYLSKFAFGFRFKDSVSHSCYIDYVSVDIKPDDGVAPVITYTGSADIATTANKPFVINASAYDEYEERAIPIDYAWSSDPFDANGKLVEGVYTCTISATDYYGNKSDDIVLNVTVGPQDTQAPVIDFDLTEVYSIAGCAPVINVSVTDDHDDVALQIIWSVNALDARGRLTQGDHTLTLRSSDLTGNTAEKVVNVYAGTEFVTTKPVEYEQ